MNAYHIPCTGRKRAIRAQRCIFGQEDDGGREPSVREQHHDEQRARSEEELSKEALLPIGFRRFPQLSC